jgi:Cu(I)/Ag(I) efflux system membrane fusion protein
MSASHQPLDAVNGPGAAVEIVAPRTAWKKLKLAVEVLEVRLRFIVVLAAVGALIVYWDSIKNHWDKWTRPAHAAVASLPADEELYCPMHPQVVRSSMEPNGEMPKCPICGMPLSLRKKGVAPRLSKGVTGRVQLSPERIQMAGVETVPVQWRPMNKEITTVGEVAYDETKLSRIASRVSGYVEKLYVDRTFARVGKGDPLADVYSPELYIAAKELVLTTRPGGPQDLAPSARQRLALLGVGAQEIDQIAASGKAVPRLTLRSPQSGYVIAKDVVEGSRVEEGMTLVQVADLATVWIEADVYERDIALLRPGQKIQATVEALPNRSFFGTIALVYPRVDAATRTNRVRFTLDNASGQLRPGMYANVRISVPLKEIEPFKSLIAKAPTSLFRQVALGGDASSEVPTVPESAVVDTGTKKIVYVEREPGLFEGVEVELGPRTEGLYPVIQGLAAGDRVAAAGSFLIDAETRLNPAAASTYFGASGGPTGSGRSTAAPAQPSAPAAERPNKTADVPAAGAARPEAKALSPKALENIARLSKADQALALAQKRCPITDAPLGGMGVPVKVLIKGQTVFLCCPGCEEDAKAEAEEVLKKVAGFKGP